MNATTATETPSWERLLAEGTRIDGLDRVAPGDVAFLHGPATPYLAFQIERIHRGNGTTLLYMSGLRACQIGGLSRFRFSHAIRPAKEAR